MSKEGELRVYAKKEVEGLLSTKVMQIRKEVEQGRQLLRQLESKRIEEEQLRSRLEVDLRNTESVERRRTEVALETE